MRGSSPRMTEFLLIEWESKADGRRCQGECRSVERARRSRGALSRRQPAEPGAAPGGGRSEEHTSELQSLMRISYAVFCLKKKNKPHQYQRDEDIYGALTCHLKQ